MSKFNAGDRVAWHHTIAAAHAAGSVLHPGALPAGTPIGVVESLANEAGTHVVVRFPADAQHGPHHPIDSARDTHPDDNCYTLTADELVRVEGE